MNTTPKNRREQIEQRSREFAKKHPAVGPLFDRFALEKVAQGFRHYSASAVWHRIRWETPAGADGLLAFKLNNDFIPHYARAFMRRYPSAPPGFFRTRRLTSADSPPVSGEERSPGDYPADAP